MRTKEEWKEVLGYEGLYKVSSLGNVLACVKSWNSGRWITRSHPDKIMRLSIDKKGYFILGLRKDGKQKMWKVHRLVAIAFIPNPYNKPQVNHLDTNKKNNKVSNLTWATSAENMQHAHDNDLMNLPKGETHFKAKLKADQVREIRKSELSSYKLAGVYGVSRATIQKIKSGNGWVHI